MVSGIEDTIWLGSLLVFGTARAGGNHTARDSGPLDSETPQQARDSVRA